MRMYLSPLSSMIDSRAKESVVSGMALANPIEETPVDLVNDLEMPGQKAGKERQWPFLERLGEQRVVRVAARSPVMAHASSHAMPCWSTSSRINSATAIDGCVSFSWTAQQASNACSGLCRASVQPDHVLQRAADEEIVLLRQPKSLPGLRLVIRIEDFGDCFGGNLCVHGTVVVADVERVEVEGLSGFGLPQTEQVRRRRQVPGTGVSNATPRTTVSGIQRTR